MILLLSRLSQRLDHLSDATGRAVSWLTLALVIMQFIIVIGHYIFHVGAIFLQESLLYMHSVIFLGASAYTLRHGGHVRVDIFYSSFNERVRAWVNLLGCLFFLFPVVMVIGWMGWPYVAASWQTLEGSIESSGIQAVYLLKSMILFFAASLLLQGLSLLLHSGLTIIGADHMIEEQPEMM